MLDFYVKTRIIFSLRDKRLFEITEDEITRVDCISKLLMLKNDLRVQIYDLNTLTSCLDSISVVKKSE